MFGSLFQRPSLTTSRVWQQPCSKEVLVVIMGHLSFHTRSLTRDESRRLFDWLFDHSGMRINSMEECADWLGSLSTPKAVEEGLLIVGEIFWLMQRRHLCRS